MDEERNHHRPIVWGVQLRRSDPAAKRILWGIFLIVVGCLLMASRLGYIAVPSIWKLWPVVFLAIGGGHVLERRAGAACAMLLMGLAFFAAEFHWMGLTYRTFWPLLIIAVGTGLVIRALTREDDRPSPKEA